MSVTTNSVTLQWKPPHTTNGVITHYSVQYGETVIDKFGNDKLEGNIKGLSPDTEYVLQLRAHTRVGAGPPGCLTVRTSKPLKLVAMYVARTCKLLKVVATYTLENFIEYIDMNR